MFALAAGGIAAGARLQENAAAAVTDDKIDLAKVPAKVKEAASKALPGAKWTGASKSVEDGKVTYQLDGEDANKHFVSVELTADADVNEVQFEIAIEKAPKLVTGRSRRSCADSRILLTTRQLLLPSAIRRVGYSHRHDYPTDML